MERIFDGPQFPVVISGDDPSKLEYGFTFDDTPAQSSDDPAQSEAPTQLLDVSAPSQAPALSPTPLFSFDIDHSPAASPVIESGNGGNNNNDPSPVIESGNGGNNNNNDDSVTSFPATSFPNERLKNAYVAFQAWKDAIHSDPFNTTGNWVGNDVCSYTGVFCAPALDDPN